MNKLWDDLKDNMKEWSASAVEKAEKISRVAVAKGEEFTKISKLKIEIIQLQKQKDAQYKKLGKLVFNFVQKDNLANFTGNTEFFKIVDEINGINKNISVKNDNIDTIKNLFGIDDLDESLSSNDYIKDYASNEEE
tara:strand:+ start:168 stop:575 length:408 start_codon:yes stop_codon:yes gene_type:complete